MNTVLLKNRTFIFYNFYMQKIKIFITFFILYEFIAITVLQIPEFCFGIFNYNFCETGYKYFLFCVMVPVLICLLFWWLPKKEETTQKQTFFDMLFDIVPPQYIKRFLIAAVIVGLRKFIMSHPKAKDFLSKVENIVSKRNIKK